MNPLSPVMLLIRSRITLGGLPAAMRCSTRSFQKRQSRPRACALPRRMTSLLKSECARSDSLLLPDAVSCVLAFAREIDHASTERPFSCEICATLTMTKMTSNERAQRPLSPLAKILDGCYYNHRYLRKASHRRCNGKKIRSRLSRSQNSRCYR